MKDIQLMAVRFFHVDGSEKRIPDVSNFDLVARHPTMTKDVALTAINYATRNSHVVSHTHVCYSFTDDSGNQVLVEPKFDSLDNLIYELS